MFKPAQDKSRIHSIHIKRFKNNTGFYIDVVFTISKSGLHYKQALKDSGEFYHPIFVFKDEDVQQYKLEDSIDPDAYRKLLKKRIKGIQTFDDGMFEWNEKSNTFSFSAAVYDCYITNACIQMLKELQVVINEHIENEFDPEDQLLKILYTLQLFWD